MKTQVKLLIGLGIATAVTAGLAIGIIRELKAIRNLTINADDLPEDLFGEDEIAAEAEEAEAEAEAEAVAE